MADGSTKSIDELLEQARRLKAQTEQGTDAAGKGKVKSTPIGDALNDVKAFNATAKEVRGGMALVKETSKSVFGFLRRTWPVRAWMWAFKKFCYKKDKETGERKLRPTRAKAMVLTTAFLASAMIPGMIGAPARATIGAVGEPISDGVKMTLFMHKDEIVYLNDQHIHDAKENVWVVKGTTKPNGDVNDAILFKVKPSLMNDLWQWKNKGDPFFLPDRVVSPVAPSGNGTAYRVTYYGARWRIATWLQAYPYLLDVQALPQGTTPENFNKAATPQIEQKAPVQQVAPVQTAPVQQPGGQGPG
jgi:hypothetical protein